MGEWKEKDNCWRFGIVKFKGIDPGNRQAQTFPLLLLVSSQQPDINLPTRPGPCYIRLYLRSRNHTLVAQQYLQEGRLPTLLCPTTQHHGFLFTNHLPSQNNYPFLPCLIGMKAEKGRQRINMAVGSVAENIKEKSKGRIGRGRWKQRVKGPKEQRSKDIFEQSKSSKKQRRHWKLGFDVGHNLHWPHALSFSKHGNLLALIPPQQPHPAWLFIYQHLKKEREELSTADPSLIWKYIPSSPWK